MPRPGFSHAMLSPADIPETRDRTRDRQLFRLLRNEALAVIESSCDAIFAQTLEGVIVSWNRGAERIYGYPAQEILGRTASVLFPPELSNELPALTEKLANGQSVDPHETIGLRKDGSRIHVSMTVSPILNSRGKVLGASSIARDISDQKRSEEYIRYLATHDSATELPNYTSLMEAFDTELRRSDRTGRPFALLLLDVDRLKTINDTEGHLVGTRVLRRLASILKRTCRSIDTPARYGGDEFAVLLVETNEGLAVRVAQRIKENLAKDAEQPVFTVSAGISVYPQHGYTIENLLANADRALYRDKLQQNIQAKIREGENERVAGPLDIERRRSQRLLLDIPLMVRGESNESTPFHEKTFTISVSAHGALLVLATKVTLGQKLYLENPQTQCAVEGRVVRFGSPYGGLAQVGIDFTQPTPNFWPIEPVPASWRPFSPL